MSCSLDLYVHALRTQFGFGHSIPILIGKAFEEQTHEERERNEHIDVKLLKLVNLDTIHLVTSSWIVPSHPRSEDTAPYSIERMTCKLSLKYQSNDFRSAECIILRRLNHTDARLSIYCTRKSRVRSSNHMIETNECIDS
jgi:hypothetical protein